MIQVYFPNSQTVVLHLMELQEPPEEELSFEDHIQILHSGDGDDDVYNFHNNDGILSK